MQKGKNGAFWTASDIKQLQKEIIKLCISQLRFYLNETEKKEKKMPRQAKRESRAANSRIRHRKTVERKDGAKSWFCG